MKTCSTCKWYDDYNDYDGACDLLSRNNCNFGKLTVEYRGEAYGMVIEVKVKHDFGCTEHEERKE